MAKPSKLRKSLGWVVLVGVVAAVGANALRPSLTRIIDVKLGSGPPVKAGDTVVVQYVGTLADGTVFENSRTRRAPSEFLVGGYLVIDGWNVGVVGMRAGGIRRLIVPPEEAYGAAGKGQAIPPNSTLTYEVELIRIR